MLQGFLNESAMTHIRLDQDSDPIKNVLRETIQLLNTDTLNEAISTSDISAKIKRIIDTVVEFFRKIFSRISQKMKQASALLKNARKAERDIPQLKAGVAEKEFTILHVDTMISRYEFPNGVATVGNLLERIANTDTPYNEWHEQISLRVNLSKITKVIERGIPNITYTVKSGKGDVLFDALTAAISELEAMERANDRVLQVLKHTSEAYNNVSTDRVRLASISASLIMESYSKYVTVWTQVLSSAQTAVTQYERWMKSQMVINDNANTHNMEYVYAINESTDIDTILQESIQSLDTCVLNEGLSASPTRRVINSIIDALVRFVKKIGEMIAKLRNRGKSTITECKKTESEVTKTNDNEPRIFKVKAIPLYIREDMIDRLDYPIREAEKAITKDLSDDELMEGITRQSVISLLDNAIHSNLHHEYKLSPGNASELYREYEHALDMLKRINSKANHMVEDIELEIGSIDKVEYENKDQIIRAYKMAIKVTMEISAKFNRLYTDVANSYEHAITEYKKWIEGQDTIGESVTVYNINDRSSMTEPIDYILQESIQSLDMCVLNEGIDKEKFKAMVQRIIETFMNFIRNIGNKIRQKLSSVRNTVKAAKTVDSTMELPEGNTKKSFTVLEPLTHYFEVGMSIITKKPYTMLDTPDDELHEYLSRESGLTAITKILNNGIPDVTYELTAGDSSKLTKIVEVAEKELKSIELAGSQALASFKQLLAVSPEYHDQPYMDNEARVYNKAAKIIMESQAKYTQAWISILGSAENALIQYTKWMKSQMVLGESIDIDSILQESIQSLDMCVLNEGLSLNGSGRLKQLLNAIMQHLMEFLSKILTKISHIRTRYRDVISRVRTTKPEAGSNTGDDVKTFTIKSGNISNSAEVLSLLRNISDKVYNLRKFDKASTDEDIVQILTPKSKLAAMEKEFTTTMISYTIKLGEPNPMIKPLDTAMNALQDLDVRSRSHINDFKEYINGLESGKYPTNDTDHAIKVLRLAIKQTMYITTKWTNYWDTIATSYTDALEQYDKWVKSKSTDK